MQLAFQMFRGLDADNDRRTVDFTHDWPYSLRVPSVSFCEEGVLNP